MATYEVLIEYDELTYYPDGTIRGYDRQSIYLDQVDNITINATSDLTTHPMLNGDLVSDHIIKKPITVSFGGTFSTNGSTKSDLIQKQTLFENIKNNGWFCHISKINRNTNKPCFIKRNNLVLTSIQWTEGINYVTYSFTFNQVFVINEIGYSKADVEYLPETLVAGFSNFDMTNRIADNEIYWELLNVYYRKRIIGRGLYTNLSSTMYLTSSGSTIGYIDYKIINPDYITDSFSETPMIEVTGWGPTDKKLQNRVDASIRELIGLIKEYLSIGYQFKFTRTGEQSLMFNVENKYYLLKVKMDTKTPEWLLTLYNLEDEEKILASNKCTTCKVKHYADMNDSNYFYRSPERLFFYVWYEKKPGVGEYNLTNYSIVVTPFSGGKITTICNGVIEAFVNNIKVEDLKS